MRALETTVSRPFASHVMTGVWVASPTGPPAARIRASASGSVRLVTRRPGRYSAVGSSRTPTVGARRSAALLPARRRLLRRCRRLRLLLLVVDRQRGAPLDPDRPHVVQLRDQPAHE